MTQLFDHLETPATSRSGRFAHVALERGIDASSGGLTYAVPDHLADIQVGDRVLVPLGKNNKRLAGYVVELTTQTEHRNIKPITGRDPKGVSLPPDLVELARWIANYYVCPLGMVFATMLPAAVKKGTGLVTQTLVKLSDHGYRALDEASYQPVAAEGEAAKVKPHKGKTRKLTKPQREILAAAKVLADEGKLWIDARRLADRAGVRSVTPVKGLVTRGYLESKSTREVQADWSSSIVRTDLGAADMPLSASQQRAGERLAASVNQGFSVHLLHGVTGSGKTEVYLRVIEHLTKNPPTSGGSGGGELAGAIVLVPEIALTPQTVARFVGRFPSVAVLHSGLSAAQRHEQWRRIRSGEATIVVGARSAIFAPLPPGRLGVIIVDEEHEHSYKQDQLPRYNARDVAIKRGQILNIPVVLGSATPSLESYFNATVKGTYHLLELPERVAGFKLPVVEVLDLVQERRAREGVHLVSQRLEKALGDTLAAGGQAILLLNRRGYANYIACPDHRCGWMKTCDYCDTTMVYHRAEPKGLRVDSEGHAEQPLVTVSAAVRPDKAGGLVRCHHCEAEQVMPRTCPVCNKKLSIFGLGTQRVEEELARKFPGVPMLRMDSDAMRTARDYDRSLDAFRRGDVKVLMGTQMIAKGLDFPNVRVVGVISGDTSLHMPDFRAGERTFQLIAQVAGRAGRGEHAGLVIVQSFSPTDPAIVLAAKHDYETFAKREIKLRQDVGLPPATRMARVVVRDQDHMACLEMVAGLAQVLRDLNERQGGHVRMRGPMPCPIARIGGFHRQQIELIADDAATLQRLLTAARNAKALKSDTHMAVDVDPVALL
jgi:primosomal protein N' (replication factor Y) (superfamily II helicase)